MMYPYMTLGDGTEIVHSQIIESNGIQKVIVHFDYSGPPAYPVRSSAQPDRASAHLMRSAVQPMLAADQHTC